MINWLYSTQLLNNPALYWLYAAAGALAAYLLSAAALAVAGSRLRGREQLSPSTPRRALLALIESTRRWILFLLAIIIGLSVLDFDRNMDKWLGHLTFMLISLQIALWANRLIVVWLRTSMQSADKAVGNPVMLGILSWAMQFVIWMTLLMALLANMNVNITAFVASLGVGGVAVALALQNILGDLFASISIGIDKPFEVGEFIAFGDVLGTVVHVGVKSTRINSLSGEQLIISNSNLLKELVHNYSRMQQRRVVFGFRVPYDTTRGQMQEIVDRTKQFISELPETQLDRGHFLKFGEFGLEFEFVYYKLRPDYTAYCDTQQQINMKIMDLLEEMNLRFAIPARRIHVSDDGSGSDGVKLDAPGH